MKRALELSVGPAFDIDPLVQAQFDQVEGLLDGGGSDVGHLAAVSSLLQTEKKRKREREKESLYFFFLSLLFFLSWCSIDETRALVLPPWMLSTKNLTTSCDVTWVRQKTREERARREEEEKRRKREKTNPLKERLIVVESVLEETEELVIELLGGREGSGRI